MSEKQQGPSSFPWPPVVYVGAVAIALILGVFVPIPWITIEPLNSLLLAVGVVIALGGGALYAQALRGMHRAGTTKHPTEAASHLMTSGAFGISRNPIYLGATMVVIGAGLVFGLAWLLVFAVLAAFATQKLAIEPEERHLAQKFGKKYHDYARKVRRWF